MDRGSVVGDNGIVRYEGRDGKLILEMLAIVARSILAEFSPLGHRSYERGG